MSAPHDPTTLPADLPVPQDDGACDHLPGRELPDLSFPATSGGTFALREPELLVLYLYPRTGRPGLAIPPEWDATPGARGCTPQSCGFRDRHDELRGLGATVAGLSSQDTDWQREAVDRLHLPFPLLADPELRLARALDLPTFVFEGDELYKRVTLVARGGRIVKVFYPVFPPNENAADVARWLAAT